MQVFRDAPSHFGQHLANQTLEWLPTDTKESYEKLIQDAEHRKYFSEMGWDKPGAITYKFNSHGFRADEFNGGPYLLTLGCSYTAGIGLPDEATWPRLVATAMNLKCANIAWGGYSTDSCYRLGEYWIPALRPDYVCMLAPPKSRIELLMEKSLLNAHQPPVEIFLPESQSLHFNKNDVYLNHWFLNVENAKINQRKNIYAIKQLCLELNIPCTVINAEDHMHWSREEIGYARDFMHGGPKIHKTIAEMMINEY